MMPVYLVCGVSGSGKSWACRQLTDKYHYIEHDKHFKDHLKVVFHAARTADKPVITEVPFAERILKEKLESHQVKVIPVFVVEAPEVVAKRYSSREKKPLPKNAYTRATTIVDRAKEWNAFQGTSQEVLDYLKTTNLMVK